MRLQATLTVNEAKRIIAQGISRLPEVKQALLSGKIFLKGGTTVSAVCEELAGRPLRISGRISPRGTVTAHESGGGHHCAVLDKGVFHGADGAVAAWLEKFGPEDVAVIGANAMDVHGQAALMYGVSLGGEPGTVLSGLMAEIKNVYIAAGWEKLVPGSIFDLVIRAGRKNVDRSMGTAVGLTPVFGRLVTETEALATLAGVSCAVIGRGGVHGAEGATTMLIEGEPEAVEKADLIIRAVKGQGLSGTPESLIECRAPSEKCRLHLACIYKKTPKKVRPRKARPPEPGR
ncbi:MAG: hypothetical protein AB1641_28370 [Thermodesulfobacteriota bacterium]